MMLDENTRLHSTGYIHMAGIENSAKHKLNRRDKMDQKQGEDLFGQATELVRLSRPASSGTMVANILVDPASFEHIQRVAKVYAASKMVPEQYQDKIADCIIAMQMADRLGVDTLMFMQNTYVVKGKPGMEAKLVISLVNIRGPFTESVRFRMEGQGDSRSCTAFASLPSGAVCEGYCDVAMAKKMGWWEQNALWRNLTDLMLQYRSATFLARTHCPEVMMGMQTTDELRDVIDITPVEPAREEAPIGSRTAAMRDARQPPADPEAAKPKGKASKAKEEPVIIPEQGVVDRGNNPKLDPPTIMGDQKIALKADGIFDMSADAGETPGKAWDGQVKALYDSCEDMVEKAAIWALYEHWQAKAEASVQ